MFPSEEVLLLKFCFDITAAMEECALAVQRLDHRLTKLEQDYAKPCQSLPN